MGPLAMHMTVHILLMNVGAPLAALAASRVQGEGRTTAGRRLGFVATAQVSTLWIWHAPPLLNRAIESTAFHLLMHGSLFLSAFLFWSMILRFDGARCWKPIVALLFTSKLYCLLAVLFVFAPRVLYPNVAASHSGHEAATLSATLADQQLAGLIMLIACPATYVLAGIAIAARWLFAMENDEADPETKAGAGAWT